MKKTIKISLCCVLAMLFVFAAVSCSNAGNTSKPEQGAINVENRTYENKSIGLGLRLKEGWTIKSTEELQTEINKLNFEDSIKNSAVVYDFFATNEKSDNIIILFDNTKKNNNRVVGEDEYIQSYMRDFSKSCSDNGITLNKIESVSLKIDKTDYNACYIESSVEGIDIYQYVLFKQIGEFITCVTISAHSTNDLNSIFYCLYSVQ